MQARLDKLARGVEIGRRVFRLRVEDRNPVVPHRRLTFEEIPAAKLWIDAPRRRAVHNGHNLQFPQQGPVLGVIPIP